MVTAAYQEFIRLYPLEARLAKRKSTNLSIRAFCLRSQRRLMRLRAALLGTAASASQNRQCVGCHQGTEYEQLQSYLFHGCLLLG
jgi:hypothetical protein